jgi:hypothetical protein
MLAEGAEVLRPGHKRGLDEKMNTRKSPVALAKGQLWRTNEGYIEIMELKRLIHYKFLKEPGQRLVRTRMSGKADFESYLKDHEAELVE